MCVPSLFSVSKKKVYIDEREVGEVGDLGRVRGDGREGRRKGKGRAGLAMV